MPARWSTASAVGAAAIVLAVLRPIEAAALNPLHSATLGEWEIPTDHSVSGVRTLTVNVSPNDAPRFFTLCYLWTQSGSVGSGRPEVADDWAVTCGAAITAGRANLWRDRRIAH